MSTLTYKVRLKQEPEGGYTVTVPALPGCVTYGQSVDEGLTMAKEAIEGYISVLEEMETLFRTIVIQQIIRTQSHINSKR